MGITYSPGLNSSGGTPSDPTIVQVEDSLGSIINPATEETLESVAGFNIPAYDYISVAYPDAVTEVYTFKTGGSGGTTVGTLTVVYTNSTKENLSNVTKS